MAITTSPKGMTVLVASHIPVNQFVADDSDHGDWQLDPPVRDQSLTHTRLSADLNQEPAAAMNRMRSRIIRRTDVAVIVAGAFPTQPVSPIVSPNPPIGTATRTIRLRVSGRGRADVAARTAHRTSRRAPIVRTSRAHSLWRNRMRSTESDERAARSGQSTLAQVRSLRPDFRTCPARGPYGLLLAEKTGLSGRPFL
jgi:hypothetical protein